VVNTVKHKGDTSILIFAEHLKNASLRLVPLLSMCITGFLVHGTLPENMISVILVPVIKDKAGKINSKANYRPIALASVLSKVLEIILLNRLELYLLTNANQYGFKHKHGTDMAIYALKETVLKYHSMNATMFLCFLDASKAFDRVNHAKLFQKLVDRKVPGYLIRILMFWYSQQTMIVRWGDSTSQPFNVSNGVRQGGILSPFLFNVYMDELSNRLNACKIGCMVGNIILNHIMYADDLVIFCSYSAGMEKMLNICAEYGIEFDIKYNSAKSNMLIVRSKEDKHLTFPSFTLNDEMINVCDVVKYLGHMMTDDFTDDKDIYRQCRKLYAQGNMLVRKFHMCTIEVKVSLFRSFCTPLYTAQIWWNYRKYSINRLNVAYNDVMRLLLRVPRYTSASQMFTNVHVPTCHAVIRNLTYKFMCRLEKSQNDIIKGLVDTLVSDTKYNSPLWKHWHKQLYVHFYDG